MLHVKLKVLFGKNDGKEVSITSPSFVVGRSEECQLRPKSDAISRRHCEIKVVGDTVTVCDLKSKNGTFVNGDRIDRETTLRDGDSLRVGKLDFQVLMIGSAVTTAISSPSEETSMPGPVIPETPKAPLPVSRAMTETTRASITTRISGSDESDIGDWLEEGDESDRAKQLAEPDTRHFKLEETQPKVEATQVEAAKPAAATEVVSQEPEKGKGKPKPGKLPALPKATATDSRQAAADMLKKFFNRR